ncbi:MAG: hypothetical protein JO057_11885 [Chloroflexi bacterium]|nr:hypothetical protein [Chloroflexota bacterium]
MAALEQYQLGLQLMFPVLESSTDLPKLLHDKVARGDVGMKSGRGFYEWTPEMIERERRRVGRALPEIARWDALNADAR